MSLQRKYSKASMTLTARSRVVRGTLMVSTKDTSKMGNAKATAHFSGTMVKNLKETGKMD